ncbi:MAG: VCBS repeat-containing protein [Myxococcales bacterium]|nr:VCBS repeat-containing protein [Myxococcales bacterium]
MYKSLCSVVALSLCAIVSAAGCTSESAQGNPLPDSGPGGMPLPQSPACAVASGGGKAQVSAPTLLLTLKDRYEEAWLGSAAVADLDGDGKKEIIAARGGLVVVWKSDGTLAWRYATGQGRIWSSPVVADFVGDRKLEVAVAARDRIFLLDANGQVLPGFPVTWQDELRSLAGGDIDGDGKLDLIASVARSGPTDVVNAFRSDGSKVAGFPPNMTGTSGCATDKLCYLAGCYDQNLAVGDLDGDNKLDLVAPHDNAYASFHKGSGVAFDASAQFKPKKTPGVRYLHDLAEAQRGYATNEETALQAHFTNTAPAIADLDEDGKNEVVMLGSVQNAAQSNRLLGVGLWALRNDASRVTGWESPFHAPQYLSGLWDLGNTNIVAATNQVSIADISAQSPGKELIFAGFDGTIHAVSAQKKELWSFRYTSDPNVLTAGVAVGDLSGDGIPEVVFSSYSTDADKSALYILDAGGNLQQKLALPRRGAMPVPTLADVNGDGTVEIVVSLKDALDKVESVLVYTVAGSATNCLPWPTGRADLLRSGTAPKKS